MKGFSFSIGIFFLAVLFGGCGGGGSGGDGNPGGDNSLTDQYTVRATVTGLDGELRLKANEQSLDVNSNGSVSFPATFLAGTVLNIVVENKPFRQNCVVDNSGPITMTSDVDVTVNCSPQGVLTGTVRNYYTGEPLANIQVSLTARSGADVLPIESTVSDGSGNFMINGIGISDRFVLSAFSAEYGRNSIVLTNDPSEPNINAIPLVLNANVTASFDSLAPIALSSDGLEVISLPANAFANSDGTPFDGQVSATITVIDPSSDASIMPGEYEAINPGTGEQVGIESFGAVDYVFRDPQGNPLQLRAGVTALINIPVANSVLARSLPATMPLYYFDTASGFWVEEGSATLQTINDVAVYQGNVSQVQTWNADLPIQQAAIQGCVVNGANQPIVKAKVTSFGRDYIGSSSTLTDENGNFSVNVRAGSQILISATSGSQSSTLVINSNQSTSTIEQCLVLSEGSATLELTWGENPRDLDSHLYIPLEEGGERLLYFANKQVLLGDTVIALDVDDTTSYGPEVVTIPTFPNPGKYRYVVHLYSGSSTIKDSPARIVLNFNGDVQIFSPDVAVGDPASRFWHVVNFVVAQDGSVALEPVQQFSASNADPLVVAPLEVQQSQLRSIKQTKLYAPQ